MSTNGRKCSRIWDDNFERIQLPERRFKSRCKICDQTWSGAQPKRLIQHRLNCGNTSGEKLDHSDGEESPKKRPKPSLKPSVKPVWIASEPLKDEESSSDSSYYSNRNPINVSQTRQKIPIITKVTSEETQNLEDLFGMFVFSQAEPYKIAESPHLKAFLKALRPDYEIPSIVELRTIILNRCKEKVSSMIPIAANVFEDDELDDFKSKLN